MKPTVGQAIDNMIAELMSERNWWKGIVEDTLENGGKMTEQSIRKAKQRAEVYDDF